MAVIINGDTGIDKITDGSVVADDLASTLDLSGKTVTLATDAVDQLSTASGSAPSYSARAWVNFNGTGTVAIRDSGNVSSITDINVGRYQINFTTAMPDANYSPIFAQSSDGSAYWSSVATPYTNGGYSIITPTTSSFVFGIQRYNYSSWLDVPYVLVAVFR